MPAKETIFSWELFFDRLAEGKRRSLGRVEMYYLNRLRPAGADRAGMRPNRRMRELLDRNRQRG